MGYNVHVLLTNDSVGSVPRLEHSIGRNCTGLFNGRHGDTWPDPAYPARVVVGPARVGVWERWSPRALE